MTTDKFTLDRITLDLHEAIIDEGEVECTQLPDIFFPEDLGLQQDYAMKRLAENTAREICMRCPVIAKCLKVGMFEDYGIWGGTTPEQRKKLRKQNPL